MRWMVFAVLVWSMAAQAVAGPHEDALIAADKAFSEMARTKGPAAAYAAFAAPDIRMFDDGEGIVAGIGNIQKVLEMEYAEGGTVSWTPAEAVASTDGTMGYTIGDWRYVTAESPEETGYYLTIWRKQADGSWKIAVDADTTEVEKE